MSLSEELHNIAKLNIPYKDMLYLMTERIKEVILETRIPYKMP